MIGKLGSWELEVKFSLKYGKPKSMVSLSVVISSRLEVGGGDYV